MTKNVAIYHIYRMIERDSDEDHKLTQKEIVERLKSEHDIVLERKAVGRAIDELAQIDDNIRKIPHGGVYMEQRTFESCELFFLLDSVYYNRQLPQKQARDMIDKLISLGLVSFRKQAKKQYKEDVVTRPQHSNLLLYLEVVNEAIRDQVKIRVKFGEESIVLCPFAMALNHGQYWLVTAPRPGNNKPAEYFPIALVDDIKVTEEKMNVPSEERIYNIRRYINNKDSGYSRLCNMVKAGIKVKNVWLEKFEETFGEDYYIESKTEREFVAQVYGESKTIETWCIENCNFAELVSPEFLRKHIVKKLQRGLSRYGIAN